MHSPTQGIVEVKDDETYVWTSAPVLTLLTGSVITSGPRWFPLRVDQRPT